MKLLATLLKKDLVVNQSDFQAKKKKKKSPIKKGVQKQICLQK